MEVAVVGDIARLVEGEAKGRTGLQFAAVETTIVSGNSVCPRIGIDELHSGSCRNTHFRWIELVPGNQTHNAGPRTGSPNRRISRWRGKQPFVDYGPGQNAKQCRE